MKRMNRWTIAIAALTFFAAAWLATCFATEKSDVDFPYAVKFENGATKFLDGDNITITSVRGTADTIKPGNIYCIRGTCQLGSHDKAMIAAYITAKHAAEGYGQTLNVQQIYVNKGENAFTLYMPMYIEGWPHISMYGDGESFSGIYFGNGDYTLKKWWAEKAAAK